MKKLSNGKPISYREFLFSVAQKVGEKDLKKVEEYVYAITEVMAEELRTVGRVSLRDFATFQTVMYKGYKYHRKNLNDEVEEKFVHPSVGVSTILSHNLKRQLNYDKTSPRQLRKQKAEERKEATKYIVQAEINKAKERKKEKAKQEILQERKRYKYGETEDECD